MKILKTLWRAIDISRRVVLNAVFFIVLLIVVVSIFSGEDELVVEPGSVLVMNLNGVLVEQKSAVDPVDEFFKDVYGKSDKPTEILTSDVAEVIQYAAKDPNIAAIALQNSQLSGGSLNKLNSIGKALKEFKASGKKIYAYGDHYSQGQYYLASFADKIFLNPMGMVELDGFASYPMYFKSALDKLKITQHVFKVGTYKAAVEPYTRDNMSDAAKEANLALLNDIWQQFKSQINENRGFDNDRIVETWQELLAGLNSTQGDFAQFALNAGLVDDLKSRSQARDFFINEFGLNKDGKTYKNVVYSDYAGTVISPLKNFNNPYTEKVAIVVGQGTIVDGARPMGEFGGDSVAKLLRQARLDDKVKAVVLRLDTPGGSAFASEVVRTEVQALRDAGKPVIASMSSVAASGGYWIASAADEIWATPSTITGSIGIFGMFMTFEKSMNELGVYTDGVATTEMAGFSPMRPLSDGAATMFQTAIEHGYQQFLQRVASGRNMTVQQVDSIGQGRIWTGAKAKELGLVDELGELNDAVLAAAKKASLAHYDVITIEPELTAEQQLIQQLFKSSVSLMPKSWLAERSQAAAPMRAVTQQFMDAYQQVNQFNDPAGVYALCELCRIN